MNRSFLIIFIPALLVAAMYLAMGIRPPTRVEIGIAIVAAVLGAWRLKLMLQRGKTSQQAAPPSALPGSPQK
jgi:ABC-type proline/glycine betaine transport system permease subunit